MGYNNKVDTNLKIGAAPKRPWIVFAVLALFGCYAIFRTFRSVTMLFPASGWDAHDIRLIYETWKQFISREHSKEAFETVTYLPYVWWCLTPLFVLPWIAIKIAWCVANFGFSFYICRRVSLICELTRIQYWACTIFFFSWLSTGLVIGLGNVALLALTGAIAAFPFETERRRLFLVPAAIKHSLVYPIFLERLIRRPKSMLVPCGILLALVVTAMAWARVGPSALANGLKAGQATAQEWMKENPTICLLPIYQSLFGETTAAQIINWVFWFALFAVALKQIRDSFILFSALLLLALLPMHHRSYDMIVALPALAVLLKRAHFAWSVLLTLCLAGFYDSLGTKVLLVSPKLSLVSKYFYQALIVALLGRLMHLDRWATRNQIHEIPKIPNAPISNH